MNQGVSQDGSMGRHGVHDSPQPVCLPDAGGVPRHPSRWEEVPSYQLGCGGTEGGGEVETRQDQCPYGVTGRGKGLPHLEGTSEAQRIRGIVPSISPTQSGPWKPAGLLHQVLYTPRPPSGHFGLPGVGGRRGGEADGKGPSRVRDSGGCRGCFPYSLGPRKPVVLLGLVLSLQKPPLVSWLLGAWWGKKRCKW